jgi:hypothetical protein
MIKGKLVVGHVPGRFEAGFAFLFPSYFGLRTRQ